jgi:hypothetical protein
VSSSAALASGYLTDLIVQSGYWGCSEGGDRWILFLAATGFFLPALDLRVVAVPSGDILTAIRTN